MSPFRQSAASLLAAILFATFLPGPLAAQSPYEVRGLTEPVGDVVLSVATPGVIAAIARGEGQFVPEGATILELNSRAEQLEVDRKQVQLQTLVAELERSELLFKTSSSMPREELERKRAEVAIARVELAQAEESVARRKVVAPFAGVVTLVPVKVGEYCELGRQVARVVDSREFFVISNVDPARAGHLQVGHTVEVLVNAAGAATTALKGEIVYVAPVIDPASGLLRIKARFLNPESRVRPGVAGVLRIPAHAAGN